MAQCAAVNSGTAPAQAQAGKGRRQVSAAWELGPARPLPFGAGRSGLRRSSRRGAPQLPGTAPPALDSRGGDPPARALLSERSSSSSSGRASSWAGSAPLMPLPLAFSARRRVRPPAARAHTPGGWARQPGACAGPCCWAPRRGAPRRLHGQALLRTYAGWDAPSEVLAAHADGGHVACAVARDALPACSSRCWCVGVLWAPLRLQLLAGAGEQVSPSTILPLLRAVAAGPALAPHQSTGRCPSMLGAWPRCFLGCSEPSGPGWMSSG
jgi:hypothetical protein